jgi:hypothetical protein
VKFRKPKFQVGDRVKSVHHGTEHTVTKVLVSYAYAVDGEPFSESNCWNGDELKKLPRRSRKRKRKTA